MPITLTFDTVEELQGAITGELAFNGDTLTWVLDVLGGLNPADVERAALDSFGLGDSGPHQLTARIIEVCRQALAAAGPDARD